MHDPYDFNIILHLQILLCTINIRKIVLLKYIWGSLGTTTKSAAPSFLLCRLTRGSSGSYFIDTSGDQSSTGTPIRPNPVLPQTWANCRPKSSDRSSATLPLVDRGNWTPVITVICTCWYTPGPSATPAAAPSLIHHVMSAPSSVQTLENDLSGAPKNEMHPSVC